jgi:hypothetical protein
MSLLNKLGHRETRDYSGGTFTDPYGLPSYLVPTPAQSAYLDGGIPITTQTALRHPAVFACIRLIADVIASLPVDAYNPDGDDQVWHLPGPQFPGDLAGMSPIKYAARTISSGSKPKSSVTTTSATASPDRDARNRSASQRDQAKEIKQRVKDVDANRDIVVLGAGMR